MRRGLDPREGGREFECQEAKRVGGSGEFEAPEKAVRPERSQTALGRPWKGAPLDLRRYPSRNGPGRFSQAHRQAQLRLCSWAGRCNEPRRTVRQTAHWGEAPTY